MINNVNTSQIMRFSNLNRSLEKRSVSENNVPATATKTDKALISTYAKHLANATDDYMPVPERSTTIQRMGLSTLPEGVARTWELQFQLIRESREVRVESENSLKDNLQILSQALDRVMSNLSDTLLDNSNGDASFIEGAFLSMSLSIFHEQINFNSLEPQEQDLAKEAARNNANVFTNAFFTHFNEHGSATAFNFAWQSLSLS